jgi:hypothetical protein
MPAPSRSVVKALLAELDADRPEPWRPAEAGDEVIGVVTALTSGVGSTGDECEIVVLDTSEGQRAVWRWHTVLHDELKRVKPAVGDVLAVRYLGRQSGKGDEGRQFAAYRVAIKRGNETTTGDLDEVAPF